MEINKISDFAKKAKVQMLYQAINEEISFSADIQARARYIQQVSAIHSMDSLHIASAEAGHADVLLSTDDRLIRACKKLDLDVRVMNPVSYLAEVIEHDEH